MPYLVKRILQMLPVAIGVVCLTAGVIHMVPGDPIDAMLGDYATAEEKEVLREKLGLTEPVPVQILLYLKGVASLDLGVSLLTNKSVAEMIAERLPATLELAIGSMLLATILSIPLGIISALHARRFLDYFSSAIALVGVAIPNFWLGPLLILLFSVYLGVLPVSGRTDISSYILPCITLGTALAAVLARMTRNSILETIKEDYVRTALAKGMSQTGVLVRHVLKNASLPVITIMGLQFGALLTGAVITEKIFDWPGLGSLILEGLNNRDYPIVQGCVLTFSGTYLLVNLLTDIVYALVDPRIELTETGGK